MSQVRGSLDLRAGERLGSILARLQETTLVMPSPRARDVFVRLL